MHPNPTFRQTERAAAIDIARARGFGILSINGEAAPITAHIPFVLSPGGDTLRAHLVASNPLWRALTDGPVQALLSISGPDGYISPDWYGLPDQVPTWNYVAVNLRGTLQALPHDEIHGVLNDLSDAFEARLAPKPIWTSDKMDPDARDRMYRQIRPIEMTIETVESTVKLGQNKPDAARLSAADGLEQSGLGHETATLAAMMRAPEG